MTSIGANTWLTVDNEYEASPSDWFRCYGYLLYKNPAWARNMPELQKALESRIPGKRSTVDSILDKPAKSIDVSLENLTEATHNESKPDVGIITSAG